MSSGRHQQIKIELRWVKVVHFEGEEVALFLHRKELAYEVKVDDPNPVFARMLQQAIGGVEGEMRVMNQYLFQAWSSRGPERYRDMLLHTGTEEIGHIEMLATAVAMNLDGAPTSVKEEAAINPVVAAKMGGQDPRHLLSAGLGATASDSNGVPFSGSWVIATGNIASDMFANVHAEASGRLLATRLYEATDDAGMKDMLSFLIARDTMHQNQWLAVLEELKSPVPVPNDFPEDKQNQDFAYTFLRHSEGAVPSDARWTSGKSVDGRGEFSEEEGRPLGSVPNLAPAPPEVHDGLEATSNGGGVIHKVKDAVKN